MNISLCWQAIVSICWTRLLQVGSSSQWSRGKLDGPSTAPNSLPNRKESEEKIKKEQIKEKNIVWIVTRSGEKSLIRDAAWKTNNNTRKYQLHFAILILHLGNKHCGKHLQFYLWNLDLSKEIPRSVLQHQT